MDNTAANLRYTMFLHTENHYQFRMTPFCAKVVVGGCSTAEINCTGYVSAGAYKKYHFGVPNNGKFHKDHRETLPNVKFVIWVWLVVKLIM